MIGTFLQNKKKLINIIENTHLLVHATLNVFLDYFWDGSVDYFWDGSLDYFWDHFIFKFLKIRILFKISTYFIVQTITILSFMQYSIVGIKAQVVNSYLITFFLITYRLKLRNCNINLQNFLNTVGYNKDSWKDINCCQKKRIKNKIKSIIS